MLVQPSTPASGRPTLSPPKRQSPANERPPLKEIYEGYAHIKNSTPARGGAKSVAAQVEDRFGVRAWEWTRIKVVYERHLEGNEYATELVGLIDRGEITPSGAYRLLNERRDDEDLGASVSTVNLSDLLGKTIHAQNYFRTVTAAVRASARLSRGDMSDDDIAELTNMIRATGAGLTQLARLLSNKTAEGTTANGQSSRRK